MHFISELLHLGLKCIFKLWIPSGMNYSILLLFGIHRYFFFLSYICQLNPPCKSY
uniref:Uncharacterized protein n=1 Tax=Anguilla anguilla TaxID=7936 RepID=A0A0E9TWM8_ANGAN